ALLCLMPHDQAQGSDVEQYFERLRERGLLIVAEEYASSHLADESLSPPQRDLLTLELARTLLQHGSLSSATERKILWQEARRCLLDARERQDSVRDRWIFDAWLA